MLKPWCLTNTTNHFSSGSFLSCFLVSPQTVTFMCWTPNCSCCTDKLTTKSINNQWAAVPFNHTGKYLWYIVTILQLIYLFWRWLESLKGRNYWNEWNNSVKKGFYLEKEHFIWESFFDVSFNSSFHPSQAASGKVYWRNNP